MNKTKHIKQLEVFIELESKEVNPNKEYIAICQEAVDKLKQELEIEERRVNHLINVSVNNPISIVNKSKQVNMKVTDNVKYD